VSEFPYFAGKFGCDGPDVTILICVPEPLRGDVSGTEARCVDCSTLVAVADSSKELLEEHPDTLIVCSTCGDIRIEESKGE